MISFLPVGVKKPAAESHFSLKRPLLQLNPNNHLWSAAVVAYVSNLFTLLMIPRVLNWWEELCEPPLFKVNHVLKSISALHIVFVSLTSSVGIHFVICWTQMSLPASAEIAFSCF